MLANERHKIILDLLKDNNVVTIKELKDVTKVSIETIRQDLLSLENSGRITRVHGGAVLKRDKPFLPSIGERVGSNYDQKMEAAETAARLIKEGDRIAIDAGSTSAALIEIIKNRFKNLTIVTNSIDVFNILAETTGFKLFLSGGSYIRRERAFGGVGAAEGILNFNVDLSFIVPSSVTTRGIFVSLEELLDVEKALIKAARRPVIFFDSTKASDAGMYRLADFSNRLTYVTDSRLPDEIRREFAEYGVYPLIG